MSARPASSEGNELARGLNLWDTSLLVLGLVIGGGIFLTPTSIAKALPSGPWILGAWIFGGVLAILVQPRVFRPLAGWVLRKFGYTKELPNMRTHTITVLLVFYAGTWVLGGSGSAVHCFIRIDM